MLFDNPSDELRRFSDTDLVRLYKNGSQAAFRQLAVRYLFIIRSKSASFRKCGIDSDDLIQEGLLALHQATRTYDEDSGASFSTYAAVCIKNRLVSLVRSMDTDKNRINCVASSIEEETDVPLISEMEPDNVLILKEELESLEEFLRSSLSETELAVLHLYLDGKSYNEIAQELSVSRKACDNAMQRVRRKLRSRW